MFCEKGGSRVITYTLVSIATHTHKPVTAVLVHLSPGLLPYCSALPLLSGAKLWGRPRLARACYSACTTIWNSAQVQLVHLIIMKVRVWFPTWCFTDVHQTDPGVAQDSTASIWHVPKNNARRAQGISATLRCLACPLVCNLEDFLSAACLYIHTLPLEHLELMAHS